MSGTAPSDIMTSPAEQEQLYLPSLYATSIASHGTCGDRINLTDFNQNYFATMFPVPNAQLWSGSAIPSPNMTGYPVSYPKPSTFSNFFRAALYRIQDSLSGTP